MQKKEKQGKQTKRKMSQSQKSNCCFNKISKISVNFGKFCLLFAKEVAYFRGGEGVMFCLRYQLSKTVCP